MHLLKFKALVHLSLPSEKVIEYRVRLETLILINAVKIIIYNTALLIID